MTIPAPGPADCMADFARRRLKEDVVSIAAQDALQLAEVVNEAKQPPQDIAALLRAKAARYRGHEPVIAAFMHLTADNLDGGDRPVPYWQRD